MQILHIPSYPGDLLGHLDALAAIAETIERRERPAFSRAASKLALDSSVLRRRMQTLESWAGIAIFHGRGASLSLTHEGHRLRDAALEIRGIVRRIAPASKREAPLLRIACTGTFLADLLPRALRDLKKKHAGIVFRVQRAGAHETRELLERGDVDFGVIRATKKPERFTSIELGRDRLWLVVQRAHPLATQKRLTLDRIAAEPLIGYAAPSFTMDRVNVELAPRGAVPWIEVSGKSAAMGYAAEGLGVAFVSLLAGQTPAHANVIARDVTHMFAPASFWLAWDKRMQAPWERDFATELRRPR